ncbi:hypothetical protein FRC07_007806 [Ceratobasidium sp. 392]|nr:hypothetical protein FRC07_007806 [Ceratobasidium sp. 392]
MHPELGLTRTRSKSEEVDGAGVSRETSIHEKDAAAGFLANVSGQDAAEEDIDPEAERRLLWKIDLLLMPLLTVSYGLQYYDKAIFSSASVFGLLEDMDLIVTSGNPPVASTTRFSTATAAFYWGFMVAAYPMSYLLQKFPVGKMLSIMVIIWGVIVMLTITVKSYPGIVVQRVFLGVAESAVSPGFVLVSSMWYKRSEQPVRIGIWYSATGLFSIFSGAVNYGIGKSAQNAPLATWKYMYIFAGSWTIAWGVLLFILLPDNPMSARMFTLEERKLAVRRLQDNMTGVESKKFKRSQFIEAITDIKIWIYMMMGAALYVTNGGVTAFGAQIVKSFGYSSLKTILMLTPGGATTAVSIYVFGAPYVLLLSLSTANVAGHTKKAFSAAAIFIGYNVGNIVAPYLIDTRTRAQHYPKAWISIIVITVFSSVASLVLRAMYILENKRRDRIQQGGPEGVRDEKRDAVDEVAWSDLTDKKNPYFRYVY